MKPAVDKNVHRNETIHKLQKILVLSFIFMVIELVGGYLSNSLAVISDALHMVIDFLGYSAQLTTAYLSIRGRNQVHSFGYYRYESLAALFNCFLIWTMTVYLLYESFARLIKPPKHFNSTVMLITAFLAILLNLALSFVLVGLDNIGIMFRKLLRRENPPPPAHTDDHSQFPDQPETHGQGDFNIQATIAHIQGDIVYSVGVFISAVIINLFPSLRFIDSACTLLFSYVVLEITLPLFKDSMEFLLEKSPSKLTRRDRLRADRARI